MSEKQIELAAKMYKARRNVITLIGAERFYQRVEEFRPHIKSIAQKLECDDLTATMEIVKLMQEKGADPLHQILALAACVEILEPSKDKA